MLKIKMEKVDNLMILQLRWSKGSFDSLAFLLSSFLLSLPICLDASLWLKVLIHCPAMEKDNTEDILSSNGYY